MDYRYTKYENKTSNKSIGKEKLKKTMLLDHPRMKNFYSYLRDNGDVYKEKIILLYDKKCVYCGNSIDNIPIELFEIDHFINSASFKVKDNKKNEINNLYPACKMCNRLKKDFNINGDYATILNPDEGICNVFFRDDDFYIRINPNYMKDGLVKSFYDKLLFNNEVRRIDYLLLSMRGLLEKIKKASLHKELACLINMLQSKRNTFTYLLQKNRKN